MTVSFDVLLALSHHVTYTLFPAADISASIESTLGVLLRFVLLPNVLPLSVEALNITSPFLFGVPLSLNHTTYTLLSSYTTIGAFLLGQSQD